MRSSEGGEATGFAVILRASGASEAGIRVGPGLHLSMSTTCCIILFREG